jgi:ribose/xylose/arabinose/galactoside ABC-type transport system permease subunit
MLKDNEVTAGPAGAPVRAPHGAPPVSQALRRIVSPVGMLPVFLVLMFVVFTVLEPRFASTDNFIDGSRQSTYLVIIAAGQMMVLLTGGFDLSVGAIISISSIVSAKVMVDPDGGIALGIMAGLGVALVFGLANGLLVAVLKISPLIATLGTASTGMGAAFLLSGGSPIVGLPASFSENLAAARIAGIPVPIYVTAVLLVLIYVVLNWTRFGRYVYAIGGNERAARLSGVSVGRNLTIVYLLSGACAGLAGILLTARVSTGDANLGSGFELQSITAAVLGGVSLRGGIGKLSGAALGAIFIAFLANGMDLIRVSSFWQQIALGVVLIAAVVADRRRADVREAG